jgi:hypothetical protein
MLKIKHLGKNFMSSLSSRLFPSYLSKTTELETNIKYKIELNFKATIQVIYLENNQFRIERFYSNLWVRDATTSIENSKNIMLKAFINTSNLNYQGEARLSINIENNLVCQKTFSLEFDQDYSGWLILNYDLK